MALFVGGPLDGKFIDVADNRDHIEVAIEHHISPKERMGKVTDIFYYKREIIECPAAEIPVFVPRSYTCEDVLQALVQGYHENIHDREDSGD